jgi:hypothetical protein
MNASQRFEAVRAEWLAISHIAPPDTARFEKVKSEADQLIDAGLWVSGPGDMLSVLGRQRDELMHSRLLAWLLVPTNRHGLGRRLLTGFVDHLWPGEELLRSGSIDVDTEVTSSGPDDAGYVREARADIVLRGEAVTIVIENKLDAGEQPDQCERLYWAWASESGNVRWVFLSPTGRGPVTAKSQAAMSAWCSMSYRHVSDVLASAIASAGANTSEGRSTAAQYLASLVGAVAQ